LALKKEDIEFFRAMAKCKAGAEKHSTVCRYPGCEEKPINSHLLQKNGILSKIAPDKHLWQLEINNYSETQFKFESRGINEIFSFDCFCSDHDTNLFKKIEGGKIDFGDYRSCLLFSLRTLFNEIFRKEVNVLHHLCLISRLPSKFDNDEFRAHIKSEELGIEDLKLTEKLIWDDLNKGTESFVLQHRVFSRLELCISASYTYDTSAEMLKQPEVRPADLIINFFPYQDSSILIMGYKKHDEKKVKSYMNCFFKESERRVGRLLTNLLLFQCETWVCSDTLYKKKIRGIENYFFNAVKFSVKNYNERKNFDINIFESDFPKKFASWNTGVSHRFEKL
jgi:hypothetical protein